MLKKLFKMGGDTNFNKLSLTLITVIGFTIIIGVWYLISYFQLIPPKILPNPFAVIGSYGKLITEYNMFENAWFSIKLNFSSYFYAVLIALPLGFLVSLFPITQLLIGKYINSIRFIPTPSIVGVFIAIFGLSFGTKIYFLSFCLLIYILPEVANKVNELQNPNSKDNVYLQTIKTMGASNWQKFRYVYFPYVTQGISSSIINLCAVSWSYVVICELIYKDGSVSGIGALINTMIRQSYMAEAYALLFLVVMIGCCQDVLFKYIDRLLFPYKYDKKPFSKTWLGKLFIK